MQRQGADPATADARPGDRATRLWAARFGPVAVAARLPAQFGQVRTPWWGADGVEPALELQVDAEGAAPREVPVQLTAWSAEGFAFLTPRGRGEASWQTRAGWARMADPDDTPQARVQALMEILLTTATAVFLHEGGLVLHSAVLWLENRAWLVTGPSTAGKTTLCGRLDGQWWSDEYAFLLPGPTGWQVCRHREFRGGKGDFPWRAPLAGILWLGPERDQTRTRPMSEVEAMSRVGREALDFGPVTAQLTLDAAVRLVSAYPVRELSHDLRTPTDRLVEVLLGGMGA